MGTYRKRPVVIEAVQWRKHGDHDAVVPYPNAPSGRCVQCILTWDRHGRVETLEGAHTVCPGDWIITGVKGEHYPCKPDIFELTYESAEEYDV